MYIFFARRRFPFLSLCRFSVDSEEHSQYSNFSSASSQNESIGEVIKAAIKEIRARQKK